MQAYLAALTRVSLRRLVRGPRHPEWGVRLEALADSLRNATRSVGARGWDSVPWALERARAERNSSPAVAGGVRVAPLELDGVPAWDLHPDDERPPRTILYLPGGGYTQGSWASHSGLASLFARAAQARLVFASYRLAPEHPFPAAVEDATRAWRALLRAGTPAGTCVLAGDSAGGGLALATLLALRDEGAPLPAGVACFSPWTDLTLGGASLSANIGFDWYPPDCLRAQARAYLAGADPRDPRASPLFGRWSSARPVFLQAGTAEILLDDSVRLAAAIRAAGGDAVLDLWPGQIHGWQFYPELLAEAVAAVERAAAFVGRVTGPPGAISPA
jgi:acetyl esterase/lipase